MALLRVVPVDLRPGLADLLGDDVGVASLDDALHQRVLMTRDQNEAIAMRDDALVFGGPDVDLLDAPCVVAFAVKRQGRVDAVLPRPILDPGVDVTKGLFVSGGALGEVHEPDLPPGALP